MNNEDIHIHIHNDGSGHHDDHHEHHEITEQLDYIFGSVMSELHNIVVTLQHQGADMSELSVAVDELLDRVGVDVDHLLQLLSDSQAREAAAEANDAADAQTIADRTAERDAALADAHATVERIKNVDPLPEFPVVEEPPAEEPPPVEEPPPAEEPPVEEPPAEEPVV